MRVLEGARELEHAPSFHLQLNEVKQLKFCVLPMEICDSHLPKQPVSDGGRTEKAVFTGKVQQTLAATIFTLNLMKRKTRLFGPHCVQKKLQQRMALVSNYVLSADI